MTSDTGGMFERFHEARPRAGTTSAIAPVTRDAGSYGRSVRSGQPIPDERLEADPLAELTVEEAAAAELGTLEEGDDAVGLLSANHPFEVLAEPDITPEEEQASEEDDDEPAPEPILGIHIEPHNQAR